MTLGDAADLRVRQEPTATISLSGDLDYLSAPGASIRLRDHIATTSGSMTVDCSGLGFTDSSGLSVLVGCWRLLHAAGRDLSLVNVHADLRRLLDVTGLSEHLHVAT